MGSIHLAAIVPVPGMHPHRRARWHQHMLPIDTQAHPIQSIQHRASSSTPAAQSNVGAVAYLFCFCFCFFFTFSFILFSFYLSYNKGGAQAHTSTMHRCIASVCVSVAYFLPSPLLFFLFVSFCIIFMNEKVGCAGILSLSVSFLLQLYFCPMNL